MAVVLCPPVGREARCAYRPLHLWSEALAQQGFQVLRYDHPGEGDSLQLPAQADQWRAWRDGLVHAADFARAHTGASRLVLCGLRIGATLALDAAAKVRPDGLVLLSPVISGEGWLRDLRLASVIQGAPETRDGAIEVDGLRLSPATVASLQQVDVRTVEPSWRAACLATPRSARELAQYLGPCAAVREFEDHATFFKEAHVNEPPCGVLEAATRWLERFAAEAPAAAAAPAPRPPRFHSAQWRERPLSFGAGLRGVLTEPRGAPGRRAVIIGNTAADPRAGIGSFAAHAARALAARGMAVLRMDFAGLGESDAPDGAWRTHVYETSRLADFKAAAEVLRQSGYSDISLLGVCTGGFHAVDAVLEGAFDHAIAINSWLIWRPEHMPLEVRSELAQGSSPDGAQSGPLGLAFGRLRASATRRLRTLVSAALPDEACRSLRARIRCAGRRKARIDLLFGRGDAAMRWMEGDFGFNGAWLARRRGVQVRICADLDHALFSRSSQACALREIFRFLDLEPGAARGAMEPPSRDTRPVIRADALHL